MTATSILDALRQAAKDLLWWIRGRRAKLAPMRLLSAGYVPRKRRVHVPNRCAMHSWCHDCDELPPPCCAECAAFGPCLDCLAKRVPGICGYDNCEVCGVK